jgi:recombination protein U
MSWDTVPGKNREGYPDPTASTALAHVQRSQRGLQSKRAGEHFENMITASLNWYKDKGVALVEKTPEPMRPLRPPNRSGQFLACYTKAGQPDFKGTLTGGRAVVFEAKHTDSDKIEYSRLTPEQISSLTLHHELGAATFILVSVGLQDFYRVPWEVWRDMKQIYGRKHMKLADLEPYRVQYIAGVLKMLEGIELEYNAEKGANSHE